MLYIERVFKKVDKNNKPSQETNATENRVYELLKGFNSVSEIRKAKSNEFGKFYSDLVLWEEIENEKFILLFGKPGIGKTKEFEHRYKQDKKEGKLVFWLHLYLLGENSDIDDLIKENELDELVKWYNNPNATAIFYIDALDEYISKDSKTLANIIRLFRKLKQRRKKFFLRISSRPQFVNSKEIIELENSLGEFLVIELLPLLEQDVKNFAENFGVTSEKINIFYDKLLKNGLLEYGKIPLLLIALIQEFKSSGITVNNKIVLLEKLIKFSIKEFEDHKPRFRNLSESEIEKKILPLIAIFVLFSKKEYICLSGEYSFRNFPLDGINYSDKYLIFKELLDTQLFERVSGDCYKFKFKSLLEFLAAKYIDQALRDNKITLNKLNNLISPDYQRVRTGLLDMSGILAVLNNDFRDFWLGRDERLISRLDYRFLSKNEREKAFKSLIKVYSQIDFYDREINVKEPEFYTGFADFKSYVKDIVTDNYSFSLKDFSIRVIWYNRFTEFANLLLDIISNPSEDSRLRSVAAAAIREVGEKEHKQKLVKILEEQLENLDDETYGYILFAIYPDVININKLATLLRHNENNSVSYSSFLFGLQRELNLDDKKFLVIELWEKIWEKDRFKSHLSKFLEDALIEIIDQSTEPEFLEEIVSKLLSGKTGYIKKNDVLPRVLYKNQMFFEYFLPRIVSKLKPNHLNEFIFLWNLKSFLDEHPESMERIIELIKTNSELRGKLYSVLLYYLPFEMRDFLYELQNEFEELKPVWIERTTVSLSDKSQIDSLKKLWQRDKEYQIKSQQYKQRIEEEKLNAIKQLKQLAEEAFKDLNNFPLLIKFLSYFYKVKMYYYKPLSQTAEGKENGIVEFLGEEYYDLYKRGLEIFFEQLDDSNFHLYNIQTLLWEIWTEYLEGSISLDDNGRNYYLLFLIVLEKRYRVDNLIENFGKQYKAEILLAFKKVLEDYYEKNKQIKEFYFQNNNTYDFFIYEYCKFMQEYLPKVSSVPSGYFWPQILDKCNESTLDVIKLALKKSAYDSEHLALLFFLDFDYAFNILFNEENKRPDFITKVLAELYYFYEQNSNLFSLLDEQKPDWSLILLDKLYLHFPEDIHPNGYVQPIHNVTALKSALKDKLLVIKDKKVEDFLKNKIKEGNNRIKWQFLLKRWINIYYDENIVFTYSDLEKIFIHGYYKLETEKDLFSLLNDILDEIKQQIEDSEVGIKSLLFDNTPNGLKRKEEPYLQRLLANLIEYKRKKLKFFPAREVELADKRKPDIYLVYKDFRIPIEIKWSNNTSRDRDLFSGIINELVESYMQKANYGFYIIGLLYNDDGSINLKPKTKNSVVKKFEDQDLKQQVEFFFEKKSITSITTENELKDLFAIVINYISYKYNKTIMPIFIDF